jgi:hypothetical protein
VEGRSNFICQGRQGWPNWGGKLESPMGPRLIVVLQLGHRGASKGMRVSNY